MIDRGFTADGRIHLSQQRSRDLYEVDPALKRCGHKTAKVTDNTAAKRDQACAPIVTGIEQKRRNRFKTFQRFVGLTIRKLVYVDLSLT